jgi:hypothetical protein
VATAPESRQPEEPPVSGWVMGGIVFAATVLVMIGIFHAIAGLVAIIDDDFYRVRRDYTFDLDTTGWGWIHLILGIILVVVGFALYARQEWAAISAVVLAGLSAGGGPIQALPTGRSGAVDSLSRTTGRTQVTRPLLES